MTTCPGMLLAKLASCSVAAERMRTLTGAVPSGAPVSVPSKDCMALAPQAAMLKMTSPPTACKIEEGIATDTLLSGTGCVTALPDGSCATLTRRATTVATAVLSSRLLALDVRSCSARESSALRTSLLSCVPLMAAMSGVELVLDVVIVVAVVVVLVAVDVNVMVVVVMVVVVDTVVCVVVVAVVVVSVVGRSLVPKT
mmetsp:Transcript_9602/g.29945  ORF Transcript_9602/g.29945 Transcript_9602/m.29945 type:complete len:198 (-) Transcript_9602:548-1141(-)